jgi:respiratory burst oxidase
MDGPIKVAYEEYKPLSDEEIDAFFKDMDSNGNGYVEYAELEAKMKQVHEELAPNPERHHLNHPDRRDVEKGGEADELHEFMRKIMPGASQRLSKEEFHARVSAWQVPSQKQTGAHEQQKEENEIVKRWPLTTRVRALWAVYNHNVLFLTFVVAFILGISLWQLLIYALSGEARAALGWGVIVAKGSAGAIYPIFIFMLLSMSRHLQTFVRRSRIISRIIDWDHAQVFHIYICIAGLFFASLHAIGHLSGSFVFASRTSPEAQQAIGSYLGVPTPRSYVAYVRSLPGWSGLVSIGLFWVISGLSVPYIRKNYFELFQLGHLLMFPLLGLLCAHGTAQLLQYPMFGFFLCVPILFVLLERVWRLIRSFRSQPAIAKRLDKSTVLISVKRRDDKDWTFSAGQYCLVQVPAISRFQWHPFTISGVHGKVLQVHIKADGDWTNKLHQLVSSSEGRELRVGIDGPFGAPAQQFYDYDYSLIIGSGIGVTPFSAIINDLEDQLLDTDGRDPWAERRRSRSVSRVRSLARSVTNSDSRPQSRAGRTPGSLHRETSDSSTIAKHPNPSRRVDFHWVVSILPFSPHETAPIFPSCPTEPH